MLQSASRSKPWSGRGRHRFHIKGLKIFHIMLILDKTCCDPKLNSHSRYPGIITQASCSNLYNILTNTVRWACPGDIERGSMSHLHCSGDTHTGPGSGSRYLTFPTRASSQWAGGWAGARASSVLTSTSDTQIADRPQAENIGGEYS